MKTVRPRLSQEAYEALERMSTEKGINRDSLLINIENHITSLELAIDTQRVILSSERVTPQVHYDMLDKYCKTLKKKLSDTKKDVSLYRVRLSYVIMIGSIGWIAAAGLAFM